MPAERDPPNEKGCVHTRIPIRCAIAECGRVGVATIHSGDEGGEAGAGLELPPEWHIVPHPLGDYNFACPEHGPILLAEFAKLVANTRVVILRGGRR